MARRKKTLNATVTKAEARLRGVKSIDPKLNLGGGMSVAAFEKEITEMRQKIDAHSNMVSKLDEASNELEMMDRKLSDLTSRMLAGVLAHYGRDSNEYEMAGGVRRSERKRRRAKPVAEAAAV